MLVWNGHAVFLSVGAQVQGSGTSYSDNSSWGLGLWGDCWHLSQSTAGEPLQKVQTGSLHVEKKNKNQQPKTSQLDVDFKYREEQKCFEPGIW